MAAARRRLRSASSPRPWGCFYGQSLRRRASPVFPTPVGVFPPQHCRSAAASRLPHARGGVSTSNVPPLATAASSPRPWGCFHPVGLDGHQAGVFPTPVGVFPAPKAPCCATASLPHARGGVSDRLAWPQLLTASSPRPWGCFCHKPIAAARYAVFPTPVGVFLPVAFMQSARYGLPHARGGVSLENCWRSFIPESSPRPWGCFPSCSSTWMKPTVFPTPVGVFPAPS